LSHRLQPGESLALYLVMNSTKSLTPCLCAALLLAACGGEMLPPLEQSRTAPAEAAPPATRKDPAPPVATLAPFGSVEASIVPAPALQTAESAPVVRPSVQSECLGHGGDQPESAPTGRACEPMEATLSDFVCDRAWGWRWDGIRCEYLGGACVCTGADCNQLFSSEADCTAAYAGCPEPPPPPPSTVSVVVDGDGIRVVDRAAEFNCCLDAWMEVTIRGRQIIVVEVEDPDDRMACDCVCLYELSVEIDNLQRGAYDVSVYSRQVSPATLIHAETVNVGP